MTVPVIFDTDAGSDIDDLYALALILKHPGLNLLGVTTVAGDTQARARLVAKMLRLAGRDDVPVRAGVELPKAMAQRGVTKEDYRQNLTHCQAVKPEDPESGKSYGDAVAFILDLLEEARDPVTLIGTGPWTNLAEVVERAGGKQRAAVKCLALMGGEVHWIHSEHNVKSDPEGADVVLRSGLPVFLGTWSVTGQLTFPMPEVESFLRCSGDPCLQLLLECTRMWWGKGKTSKPGPVCYDVIPVFWGAGERENISCMRLGSLPVELEGSYTRGMTVASPSRVRTPQPAEDTSPEYILVTDRIDAAALKSRYVDLVFR